MKLTLFAALLTLMALPVMAEWNPIFEVQPDNEAELQKNGIVVRHMQIKNIPNEVGYRFIISMEVPQGHSIQGECQVLDKDGKYLFRPTWKSEGSKFVAEVYISEAILENASFTLQKIKFGVSAGGFMLKLKGFAASEKFNILK